jgi:hypothetical protein
MLLHSDSWWHIGQVERLLRDGGLLVRGPHGEVQSNSGLWHPALAALCRLSGRTPLEVWIAAPAIVALPLVLAAGWASRALIGAGREVHGAIAFLLLFEGTHLDPLRELGYPRYVNWIFLLVALAHSVRYVSGGRRSDFVVAAVAGAATAAIHLVELALFGLLLGFWTLALLALHLDRKRVRVGRTIGIGLATVGIALPYLAWLRRDMPVLAHVLSGGEPGLAASRDLVLVSSSRYVLDPAGEFGAIATPAGYLAALAVGLLVPAARTDPAAALLVGALLGPILIALNPFVLPAFLDLWRIPDVVHRLALVMLVPWSAPAVWLAATARVREARAALPAGARSGPVRRAALWGLVLALPCAALPAAGQRLYALAGPRWTDEIAVAAGWLPPIERIRRLYPRRIHVLSDPLSGHLIAALAGHESVDHGTGWYADHDQRVRLPAFRFFRNPCQTSAETLELLRSRDVRLVVLNRAPAPATYQITHHRDAYYDASSLAFVRANPAAFRPVFEQDGWHVFEFDRSARGPLAGKDMPVRERLAALRSDAGTGSEATARTVPVAPGLEALVPPGGGRWSGRRGGDLAIELTWRFSTAQTNDLKARFHFIDRASERWFYRPEYGKLHRKILECVEGRIHRFGRDSDLVPEAYQVLEMQAGDIVRHRVTGPIFARYAPGRYEIRVEVLRKGRSTPRRLTLDDRPAPGVPVGELVVE